MQPVVNGPHATNALLFRLCLLKHFLALTEKTTRDLLDKIRAESLFHRDEPKGSLDFIQKLNVYFSIKIQYMLSVS